MPSLEEHFHSQQKLTGYAIAVEWWFVNANLKDCLCHLPPHHRVAVTGIYRATPLRVTRRQRAVKAVYRTYVDVIHFRKTDTRRLRGREEEEEEENG